MFNNLKKRGNQITTPISQADKRKAYLYKKRQLLLAQQRRMLIQRENLKRQQINVIKQQEIIELQKILFDKINQIINDINEEKIQYNSLNLNMCDNANWSEDNKKQINFLENRIDNYDENNNYIYDFSNDIIIYASYPKDYSFIYMIKKFLYYNFKKIYFVYSESDFIDSNFKDIPLLNNNNIALIKVDNIGNDFKKYYEGIKKVKENNDEYDKVWLINDSFLITKWNFFIYNLKRVGNKEIIGAFLSNEIKKHLQSYLLIMNNNILDIYFNALKNYNFKKVVTYNDKRKLITDLEINLCNDNLKEDNYGVLFGLNNNLDINLSNINPTTYFGFYCGILKKEIINFSSIDLLKLNSNEFLFIIIYILLFKNNYQGSKIEKFKKEMFL